MEAVNDNKEELITPVAITCVGSECTESESVAGVSTTPFDEVSLNRHVPSGHPLLTEPLTENGFEMSHAYNDDCPSDEDVRKLDCDRGIGGNHQRPKSPATSRRLSKLLSKKWKRPSYNTNEHDGNSIATTSVAASSKQAAAVIQQRPSHSTRSILKDLSIASPASSYYTHGIETDMRHKSISIRTGGSSDSISTWQSSCLSGVKPVDGYSTATESSSSHDSLTDVTDYTFEDPKSDGLCGCSLMMDDDGDDEQERAVKQDGTNGGNGENGKSYFAKEVAKAILEPFFLLACLDEFAGGHGNCQTKAEMDANKEPKMDDKIKTKRLKLRAINRRRRHVQQTSLSSVNMGVPFEVGSEGSTVVL